VNVTQSFFFIDLIHLLFVINTLVPSYSNITKYTESPTSMSLWSTNGANVVITTHDKAGEDPKIWETKDFGVSFSENKLNPSSSATPKESSHTIKEAAIIWTDTIATGTDHGDISVYTLEYSNQVRLELT
jgi:hypothetical protein